MKTVSYALPTDTPASRCGRGFFWKREWHCNLCQPLFSLLGLHLWMWLFIRQGTHNPGRNVVSKIIVHSLSLHMGKLQPFYMARARLRTLTFGHLKQTYFKTSYSRQRRPSIRLFKTRMNIIPANPDHVRDSCFFCIVWSWTRVILKCIWRTMCKV